MRNMDGRIILLRLNWRLFEIKEFIFSPLHISCVLTINEPGILSRYSDSLRAGRSGDRAPVETRFSAPVQTGSGAHPASYTMGTDSKAARVCHWPPTQSSAEVKERVELYLYSPFGHSWPILEWILPLLLLLTIKSNYLFKISQLVLVTDKPCVCCEVKNVLLNAVYLNLVLKELNRHLYGWIRFTWAVNLRGSSIYNFGR